ncbi:hypothetical protein LJR030_003679 [Rhizobium sp. LjRoot30]|uniref:hypothetical protein n=1 Tax=Rhizobium sp. LjRoot30 TaxID=3342320 RepID=UPI003ECCCCD9
MAKATATHSTEPTRDRHDVISDLEGIVAISRGLGDAIFELATTKTNPERRLTAIVAIATTLEHQLSAGRDSIMELYDLYFAEKKEGGE